MKLSSPTVPPNKNVREIDVSFSRGAWERDQSLHCNELWQTNQLAGGVVLLSWPTDGRAITTNGVHISLLRAAAVSVRTVAHDGETAELLSRPLTLRVPTPPGPGRSKFTNPRRSGVRSGNMP